VRLVLAALLALSVAFVSAGDAARPRIAGEIVFASERGSTLENSELYSVRPDGSGRRALSPNPAGPDGGARWSPDGTHVAFWSERTVARKLVHGLYLMRADGRGLRLLTPRNLVVARDFDPPSWSPDGTSIAFSADRGSRHGIWAIRSDGTRLRFLAAGGVGPLWSPRGDRIAFSDAGRIAVVPAAGGAVRRVTRGPNDGTPAWSPDGGTIAFVRSDANGDSQSLQLVPARGGRLRRLFGGTRDVTMGRDPQWSPSGRLLLFEVNSGVYVVRVRDRRATRLRRRGDWPTWSPDGRRIAFTVGSAIYVMNADGSRARRVRTERGLEFSDGPVWSPDGRTLVYAASLIESDFEIFVARADGSGLRQLTRNSVQDWMPAWSPARRRIAFVRRNAIWLMGADGTGSRRLFAGIQPSWSPSGVKLAFTHAGAVSTRSISRGPATSVAQGDSPAWSPSGAEIAFVRGTSLLAVDPDTKVERTIVDVVQVCLEGSEVSIVGPDWSPDGRRLVFAVVCDDGRFASTSAGVVQADGSGLRWLMLNDLATARLAWSPDGARLAFVAESTKRRIGTVKLDGTGRTTVVRDESGAAYLDPDW
jgi:Tol biopolymer transport system component